MRKLGPSTGVDEPKCRIPPKLVTTLTSQCWLKLEPFEAIADLEPAFPPLAAAPPVATLGSDGVTATTASAMGRVPGLVEKRSGAFFRLVKCTTNTPPCRAATGGTRHGQGYQQAGRSA